MSSRAESINATVRGFLPSVYSDGTTHALENPLDFEMIRLGYACGACLAYFDRYVPVSPACSNERDVARDMAEAPFDWQAFYNEETGPGEKTVANTADQALGILAHSPDVEQIQLDKLKPTKWGRGR